MEVDSFAYQVTHVENRISPGGKLRRCTWASLYSASPTGPAGLNMIICQASSPKNPNTCLLDTRDMATHRVENAWSLEFTAASGNIKHDQVSIPLDLHQYPLSKAPTDLSWFLTARSNFNSLAFPLSFKSNKPSFKNIKNVCSQIFFWGRKTSNHSIFLTYSYGCWTKNRAGPPKWTPIFGWKHPFFPYLRIFSAQAPNQPNQPNHPSPRARLQSASASPPNRPLPPGPPRHGSPLGRWPGNEEKFLHQDGRFIISRAWLGMEIPPYFLAGNKSGNWGFRPQLITHLAWDSIPLGDWWSMNFSKHLGFSFQMTPLGTWWTFHRGKSCYFWLRWLRWLTLVTLVNAGYAGYVGYAG